MFDLNVDDMEKFNPCIAKLMDRTFVILWWRYPNRYSVNV